MECDAFPKFVGAEVVGREVLLKVEGFALKGGAVSITAATLDVDHAMTFDEEVRPQACPPQKVLCGYDAHEGQGRRVMAILPCSRCFVLFPRIAMQDAMAP